MRQRRLFPLGLARGFVLPERDRLSRRCHRLSGKDMTIAGGYRRCFSSSPRTCILRQICFFWNLLRPSTLVSVSCVRAYKQDISHIRAVHGSVCIRSLTSFHLIHHAYVAPYKHVCQYESHQKYDDKHLEKGFYRVSFFIFHFVFTFFVRLTVTAFIVFAKLQVIISSWG